MTMMVIVLVALVVMVVVVVVAGDDAIIKNRITPIHYRHLGNINARSVTRGK